MSGQFMLHMDWELEFSRMKEARSGRIGRILPPAATNRALTAPGSTASLCCCRQQTTTMAGYS